MSFISSYGDKLAEWWNGMSGLDLAWLGIGLVGQSMFVLRWFIQWLASERAKKLVVPDTFWYTSLAGGLMVMAYGLYKPDPVIVLGQFGVIIYGRNVYFLWRQKASNRESATGHQPGE
jgi:lipid-A-disaccharide synthase-like uncharacterized protein